MAIAVVGLVVSGCADKKVDPLAVTNRLDITDITDRAGAGNYTVNSATLTTTALGTELRLGFTILNDNGTKFWPVSVVTFGDGSVVRCEVDDPRRAPSLVRTTTEWDFACDAAEFPASSTARLVVTAE